MKNIICATLALLSLSVQASSVKCATGIFDLGTRIEVQFERTSEKQIKNILLELEGIAAKVAMEAEGWIPGGHEYTNQIFFDVGRWQSKDFAIVVPQGFSTYPKGTRFIGTVTEDGAPEGKKHRIICHAN
jgi:hypothetical protein